ncbi:MAG: YbaB/EbfC family nucleoid-associated protein [Minisyncoccia bacterium]
MFENLKKLGELKKIADIISKEKILITKNEIEILINGKFEIEEIKISENLTKQEIEKNLKDCINEAIKKMQLSLMNKMQDFK